MSIIDELRNFEGNLIDNFRKVMDQCEKDLASAHAEICKLQGLDPAANSWPEWSPQANTLRWIADLRRQYGFN